jgi:hypothetical protein
MKKPRVRRIYGTLTPAQKRRVRKVQQLIGKELPDLIRRNQLAHNAMKEKTLGGVLRKAIHECKILLPDLATRAEIDIGVLADFLIAEQTLSSDAIDRLVKILKLKLPTNKPKTRLGRAKAS